MPPEVDITIKPRPRLTVGISLDLTYQRLPGRLRREISVIAGLAPSGLRVMVRRAKPASSLDFLTSAKKPFFTNNLATVSLTPEYGIVISLWPAAMPLRIRVSISAIGSVLKTTVFLISTNYSSLHLVFRLCWRVRG